MGPKGEKARRYIEANPDAALEIIVLLHREANRGKPNELKVQAYLYMFGHALELIRYQVERGYEEAEQMADEIRALLVLLADGHVIDEPLLISLMSCFREAKLDPGEDLRELMAERLMQEADLEQEFEPAQLDQALESLAQGFKGDAFELHEQLSDISQSMPPNYREVLVAQAAVAPFDLLRETAVFWLLDSSPQMRARTAELLA